MNKKFVKHSILFICIFIVSFAIMTGCRDKESNYQSDDQLGYLAYDEYMHD